MMPWDGWAAPAIGDLESEAENLVATEDAYKARCKMAATVRSDADGISTTPRPDALRTSTYLMARILCRGV